MTGSSSGSSPGNGTPTRDRIDASLESSPTRSDGPEPRGAGPFVVSAYSNYHQNPDYPLAGESGDTGVARIYSHYKGGKKLEEDEPPPRQPRPGSAESKGRKEPQDLSKVTQSDWVLYNGKSHDLQVHGKSKKKAKRSESQRTGQDNPAFESSTLPSSPNRLANGRTGSFSPEDENRVYPANFRLVSPPEAIGAESGKKGKKKKVPPPPPKDKKKYKKEKVGNRNEFGGSPVGPAPLDIPRPIIVPQASSPSKTVLPQMGQVQRESEDLDFSSPGYQTVPGPGRAHRIQNTRPVSLTDTADVGPSVPRHRQQDRTSDVQRQVSDPEALYAAPAKRNSKAKDPEPTDPRTPSSPDPPPVPPVTHLRGITTPTSPVARESPGLARAKARDGDNISTGRLLQTIKYISVVCKIKRKAVFIFIRQLVPSSMLYI